jgi:hypothetical protein
VAIWVLSPISARKKAQRVVLGPGIEDAADHQGQDEVAAAVAVRAEQPIEADLARGAEGRVDMTMRQRADDGNGIPVLGNDGAAFEQGLEPGDPLAYGSKKSQYYMAAINKPN